MEDGDNNICIGKNAGRNVVGSDSSTDGSKNTFVGIESGKATTTGKENTCIGYDAEVSASGAVNQIVIGSTSTGLADNSAVIGNASISKVYMNQSGGAVVSCGGLGIGLGTTAPGYTLEVKASASGHKIHFFNDYLPI